MMSICQSIQVETLFKVCTWVKQVKAVSSSCHILHEKCVLHTIMVTNLVDSASSHTLVSKIKPCMSKYKHYTVKLRMAH